MCVFFFVSNLFSFLEGPSFDLEEQSFTETHEAKMKKYTNRKIKTVQKEKNIRGVKCVYIYVYIHQKKTPDK